MSKSLGNFYTLGDLIDKGYSAGEVRYVLLGAHYRKQLNFTLDSLHAAREALGKLSKALYDFQQEYQGLEAPEEADLLGVENFGQFQAAWDVLQYDLNTQAAIGKMFAQLKRLKGLSLAEATQSWIGWHAILFALGIDVPVFEPEPEVSAPAEIRELAEARAAAKASKDWAKSDEIRDELKAKGWEVVDGKDGWSLREVK